MKVHLLRSRDVSRDFYNQVYEFLIIDDSSFIICQSRRTVSFSGETLTWDEIFSSCNQVRQEQQIPDDEFIVLLTSLPNEDNWFSACDPQGLNNIFIHTGDWEYYVPCDPQYPVAYQIVENILERLMNFDLQSMIDHAHVPPRGCISDMCNWKAEINLKIRTGDICEECLSILVEQNVDPEIIQYAMLVFDRVRDQALFARKYRHGPQSNDHYLPFSIATTRRKMICSVDPFKKFFLLLDHFDSIVRTTVLMFGPIIYQDDFNVFCVEQQLNGHPSLGHWVMALRKLSQEQNRIGAEGVGLGDDLFTRIKDVADYADRNEIVSLRNDTRGHGYVNPGNHSYLAKFENLAPIIEEIERVLLPIQTRYQLYFVSTSSNVGQNIIDVSFFSMMGSHPDFVEDSIQIVGGGDHPVPITQRTYAYARQERRWYDLHPYILYDNCPICMHNRVLLSDGRNYIDPYIGHRVEMPGC
jgi:hypothetical protein